MPCFSRGDVHLHFTEAGDPAGPAVLLLAPGGMNSAVSLWRRQLWDPLDRLEGHRVIAMDQRNAGRSTAPVSGADGWHSYTADQLALMDHLGIDGFSVVGMCIGGPFILSLCRAAPQRIAAAVMFQPIGVHDNRGDFFSLFDTWARAIGPRHPEASPSDWAGFRQTMFGGPELFVMPLAGAAAIETPVLLFAGADRYHPRLTSDRLAETLPRVSHVTAWKAPEHIPAVHERVHRFLREHAPVERAPHQPRIASTTS